MVRGSGAYDQPRRGHATPPPQGGELAFIWMIDGGNRRHTIGSNNITDGDKCAQAYDIQARAALPSIPVYCSRNSEGKYIIVGKST